MIPFALLVLAPFVAKDAGLLWNFDGEVRPKKGGYDLIGKDLRGEIAFYVTPKGSFDAEKLYRSDTQRTKEADAAKGFTHVKKAVVFAGMPAISGDQRYLWNDVPVASRCVYCVKENRAWVVRLWWSPSSGGERSTEAFLKSVKPTT